MRLSSRSAAGLVALISVILYCSLYQEVFTGAKTFVADGINFYGSFHYYVDCISKGVFPYWDPNVISGTYFYPVVSFGGLLDPMVLLLAAIKRTLGISSLTLFNWHRLYWLLIFVIGAFFLYRHISGSALSGAAGASVLLFSITPSDFIQPAVVAVVLLAPFSMYFLLLFLENLQRTKGRLYLLCLALAAGASLNVYIPAFYVFNMCLFLVLLLVFRIHSPSAIARAFSDKRLLVSFLAALLTVVMLSLPSLSVMIRDASTDGELFSMQRIFQANDSKFKKIMASEIASDALSDKFVNERASFSSYGNICNLIYSDVLKTRNYFTEHNYIADTYQYIGIIGFLLSLVGAFYHPSPYRRLSLIMLVIFFINMFGFNPGGFIDSPYNLLQRGFNALFPLLKATRIRQISGSYFSLYLGLLASLGVSVCQDADLVSRLRQGFGKILYACLAIIGIKTLLTGFVWKKAFVAYPYDIYVMAQIVVFPLLLFALCRGRLRGVVLGSTLAALLFVDLYSYNSMFTDESFRHVVLQRKSPALDFIDNDQRSAKPFDYFRIPFSGPPFLAFQENIENVKGAISRGNNHTIFTTKRYYDFLTHVPLERQFILSGIMLPIIRFFPPEDTILVYDRRDLLEFYNSSSIGEISERLFIETDPRISVKGSKLKPFSDYEDVPWLNLGNIYYSYENLLSANGEVLRSIQEDPGRLLNTPLYSLSVVDFSPNELSVSVRAETDGYLFYNDGWSRYWRAFADGVELPVRAANYNSKAVYLTKGAHSVRFVFDPIHYRLALYGFYLGLVISVVTITVLFVRSGKPDCGAPASTP